MSDGKAVLGLVGSAKRDGRTHQIVAAALEGARRVGAKIELVSLADHVVDACKDCFPWDCKTALKCSYADPGFEYLSDKLLHAGALVLGFPIYWWDTPAMVKTLILKMFRVYARSAPLAGLPALGIGIAGGTGNGLVTGLRPAYHFFQALQMRGLEPLPVTRFNWDAALTRAGELGATLAGMADARQPFAGVEDRLLWYDTLPYLGLSRAEERRLLAALTVAALPPDADPAIARGLAEADASAARGNRLQAMRAITRVYEAGVKIFEDSQGRPS
jgi:multimeric flavodoxin WrbA